eukprot:1152486-Pelagomonas_calceolata.AAC.2
MSVLAVLHKVRLIIEARMHMASEASEMKGNKLGEQVTPFQRKRKNHVGSENTPYINQGKGDTLAERATSLPHQRGKGKKKRKRKVYASQEAACIKERFPD